MNRIINRSHRPARAGLTALAVAMLALGGCSGTGSLNSADSGGTPSGDGVAGASSPLAAAVQEQGNTITDVGQAVSGLGSRVAGAVAPLVGDASAQGVEGVVTNAGGTISAVGAAVAGGLGQLGNIDNPLGSTVAGLGGAVDQAGRTVSSAGDVVTGLGQNPATSFLSPVTNAAGQVVDQAGNVVSRVGQGWETQMSTGPADQLLGGASDRVEHTVNTIVGTTQMVGATTGLGAPVADGVADPLAQAIGQVGATMAGGNAPAMREVGDIVTNTARTLGHSGDMVSAPSGAGSSDSVEQVGRTASTAIVPINATITQVASRANDLNGVGTPLGNVVVAAGGAVQQLGTSVQGSGTQPVTQGLGGLVNQTGGLVASVGTTLGGTSGGAGPGVLAPVLGTVGGFTTGNGGTSPGSNILAPVVNTVGALTGGITAPVAGGSAPLTTTVTTTVTNTVTNTVGGITGGLLGALGR
ncbi:MAG: collagen-like triple helix repeat-containing protein [Hydrogenophaga sp.]